MKPYKVLKDFKGSPTGAETLQYTKDSEVLLPDSLAEVALKEKWVSEIKPKAEKQKIEK